MHRMGLKFGPFFLRWQGVVGLQMVFVGGVQTSGIVKFFLCILVTCSIWVFFRCRGTSCVPQSDREREWSIRRWVCEWNKREDVAGGSMTS